MADNVTIISADCHAGASIRDYKPYLESRWHDEFDEWKQKYDNPYKDLLSPKASRNYDNDLRTTEQYADGIVGEVVFPNTVPPFFPTGQVIAHPPSERSFERRLAGLRSHNRWLRDFCDVLPGQRVGLPQLLLNDIDEAIADAHAAADAGFTSMLVPHIPPDSDLRPFFTDDYDRLWQVFDERGLIITMHGGTGSPSYHRSPVTPLLMVMEVPFYAQKSLWHFILSGVFERFPNLRMVLTEQGTDWLPAALKRLDDFWSQLTSTGQIGELTMSVSEVVPRKPSEYFEDHVWIGASFPGITDVDAMRHVGTHKIMWGSDYPHDEGTHPYSREALRRTFIDFTDDEKRAMFGGNAASLYGFDLGVCNALAAEHGPTMDELREPLVTVPDHDSPAFTRGRDNVHE